MDKIPVLIADDEMLAVDHIKRLVCWEELGFTIAATAFNGKQALNRFLKHRPSLVVTDIRMPLMDGITLVKEIKQMAPGSRVILLTAYEEFSYAREALKEGVDAYLIKDEITRELMEETLRDIKKTIGEYKRISDLLFQTAMLDCLNEGSAYLRQHYQDPDISRFFSLAWRYLIIQKSLPVCGYPEIGSQEGIRASKVLGVCAGLDYEGITILQYAVLPGARVLLLIKTAEQWGEYHTYQAMLQISQALQKQLESEAGERCSIFFESRSRTMEQLSVYLKNPGLLNDYGFLYGPGGVYDLKEVKPTGYRTADLVSRADLDGRLKTDHEGRLKADYDGRLKTDLDGRLRADHDGRLRADHDGRPKTDHDGRLKADHDERLKADHDGRFRADFHGLLRADYDGRLRADLDKLLRANNQTALDAYLDSELSLQPERAEGLIEQVKEILHIFSELGRGVAFPSFTGYSLAETRVGLAAIGHELCAAGDDGYSPEVKRMLRFIHERYGDQDFNITRMAEHIGMSQSRCSVLFKQETTKTINQYLTEIRIQKAKRLLELGSCRIYEIAEKVGYTSSQYLSRIFYKETGQYPVEYKKNGR